MQGAFTMCQTGVELHQQFILAEKAKLAATEPPHLGRPVTLLSKNSSAVKQQYLKSCADWLLHRAFCHDCKHGKAYRKV